MTNFAVQAGVSVALSLIAGELLETDIDSPLQDSKDTPTVLRGSACPLLLGRHSVGPEMLWAGARSSDTEDVGGGKGSGGGGGAASQDIFSEEGWHALCVGPARRLHTIRQNGKILFQGPIDPASHPSGTTVDLGLEGQFVIYWGEQDQPINTELGDADRIGITSRWPFMCYVYWTRKRLGSSASWPRLMYDVEVWPYSSKLCATPAWFVASKALVGSADDIGLVADGVTGTNNVIVDTGSSLFKAGGWCQLSGQGSLDGDYQIDHVVKGFTASDKHRQVFLVGNITGLTAGVGTLQPYADDPDDGVNAAHIVYQIMFAGFPHGLGLDPDLFDMVSLENVGVLVQEENIRSTLFAPNFATAQAGITDLMMDVGVMMPLDTVTGLYTFRPVRTTTDIAVLTNDVIVGAPEEVETTHIDLDPSTRKLFEFQDRARDYTPMPITIDNDGNASVDKFFGQKKIAMPTVRDFVTASVVAKRRDQESYSNEQRIKLVANREARQLQPGQLFSIPSLSSALLLLESRRKDSLSGTVELSAVPNYYGIAASAATILDGGGIIADPADGDSDEAVIPFEVPAVLNGSGSQRIGVGRIRTSTISSQAALHLSSDDATYFSLGQENSIQTGGTLDASMAIDGPSNLDADGPIINALGPDILTALDLSAAADKTSWERGRQIALVGDGTAMEIWFVRYLEALGGDQYRLREVIRHRLGTSKLAHAAGANVVIMANDEAKVFDDLLLAPASTVYVKSQPTAAGEIALSDIPSEQLDLYGLGVRPEPVTRLIGGSSANAGAGHLNNSMLLGDDVHLHFGWRAPPGGSTSGAGYFPAGTPVLVDRAPIDGDILLRILDGATEKRTITVSNTSGEQNYFWVDIASDFGISPGFTGALSFTVEASVVKGSQQSSLVTTTVTSLGGTAP